MVISCFVSASLRSGVIIEEGGGLGQVDVVEEIVVPGGGHPVAVGRLVLAHQQEGLVLGAVVLQPVERLVGDEIGAVAFGTLLGAVHFEEVRVVVTALVGKDFPEIEAGGLAAEVPFADDRGLIAGALQGFGEGGLFAVEVAVVVVEEAVDVGVLAGEDAGAGRSADGVGAIRAFENGSLFREAVDVRSGRDVLEAAAVG